MKTNFVQKILKISDAWLDINAFKSSTPKVAFIGSEI
jgi:hypothetical protein